MAQVAVAQRESDMDLNGGLKGQPSETLSGWATHKGKAIPILTKLQNREVEEE